MGPVRIDRYLCAARIYKTRSLCQKACTGGLVKLNGVSAKASTLIKAGDEIRAEAPRGLVIMKVRATADKRLSAALARELYEDHSPPPPPKEERFPGRDRGAGRPTKSDRRALVRFRDDI